ncbi:MAG: DUF3035 domain-containing protein [Alphaproteobacteria bacterium]
MAALLATAALVLAGCDKKLTGPDEFTVVQRAPLSVPPDYGLRPPRPGEKRPNETETRDTAQAALLGGQTSAPRTGSNLNLSLTSGGASSASPQPADAGASNGERALLKQANALDADPDIRTVLARESGRVQEDKSLVDRLVFWKSDDEKNVVVDPAAETQRLRDNAALGKAPTDGTTPTKTQ